MMLWRKSNMALQIETRKISRMHRAVLMIDVQLDGRKLDYLDAFFEEDLLNRRAGDHEKINVRSPLLDTGNRCQSAESMTQSDGIVSIHRIRFMFYDPSD